MGWVKDHGSGTLTDYLFIALWGLYWGPGRAQEKLPELLSSSKPRKMSGFSPHLHLLLQPITSSGNGTLKMCSRCAHRDTRVPMHGHAYTHVCVLSPSGYPPSLGN